jgi:hypothetical protein
LQHQVASTGSLHQPATLHCSTNINQDNPDK